jgi:hypothetical protein
MDFYCWTQNTHAMCLNRTQAASNSLISRALLQIQRNPSKSPSAFTRRRPVETAEHLHIFARLMSQGLSGLSVSRQEFRT